jgi:parallel beta-helix repeat protein
MKLFFTILLLTSQAYAATYYVKLAGGTGTGLDSNSNAWSYAKFNATSIPAGSIVKFRSGETFTGQFNSWPGTSGNPVIYDKYGNNANPKFTGYTTLTTWTLSSGNIYWASISSAQMQNVSVDGTIRAMGRYPNTGYLTYTSHSGNASISGTSVGALPNSFVGGEVVIKKFRYILDRHKITGRSGNTLSFSSTNFYGNSSNYPPTNNNGYFIQNHLSTLDQDGEWSYDASTNRLYMYFASGPSGRVVQATTTNTLVSFNSHAYITFNNLDFDGANEAFHSNASVGITLNNCNISRCGTGVYGVQTTGFTMNGGSITECSNNAFFFEADGYQTTIDGVFVNRIALVPGAGESGDGKYNGIAVDGNKTTIKNCTVKNVGFNGIVFSGDTVLVEHNLIDTFCSVKDDGGGTYTFTHYGTVWNSRIIRNNIILNAIGAPDGAFANGDPDGEAAAVYLDGFSNHTEVSGNICAHGPWGGIFNNSNSDNQILNNTAFDFKQCLLVTFGAYLDGHLIVPRNLLVTGNKFIARTVTQRAIWFSFDNAVTDNPADVGTLNNNVIARPIDDNQTITLIRSNSGYYQDMTLATWKSSYSQDASSVKSLFTTTTLSDIRFDYNYSPLSIPVPLPAIYKDVSNSSYPGSVTLSPYDGRVLIYGSALVIPPTQVGSILIKGRVVINQLP